MSITERQGLKNYSKSFLEVLYTEILKKGTLQYRIQKAVFFILIVALTIGVLYSLVSGIILDTVIMFLIMYLILGVFYLRNRSIFKPIRFWTNIIENKPEEVVWLKPVEVQHTAYFLITYAKSYRYELYLKSGDHLNIMCPNEKREEFVQLFQKYTPHIHYGYSSAVAKLYKSDKNLFLKNVKASGAYHPISRSY